MPPKRELAESPIVTSPVKEFSPLSESSFPVPFAIKVVPVTEILSVTVPPAPFPKIILLKLFFPVIDKLEPVKVIVPIEAVNPPTVFSFNKLSFTIKVPCADTELPAFITIFANSALAVLLSTVKS